MGIQRNTGRPFARIISLSDSSGKSSVAPTRWRRLFATKGVVSYCFMRSFAVCILTNSACPLHQSSNQAPRFYTILDILPVLHPSIIPHPLLFLLVVVSLHVSLAHLAER